jgi:hypothetical protein
MKLERFDIRVISREGRGKRAWVAEADDNQVQDAHEAQRTRPQSRARLWPKS